MKNKDQILLEEAYLEILNEKLKKDNFPNTIDPDTLGSEENAIQVEFNGDEYWVDYDAEAHIQTSKGSYDTHPDYRDVVVDHFTVNRIIVNLSDDSDDHIVEITKEEHPELYQIISYLAKEKYEENYSDDGYDNPNEDNPFSRDYEG